MVKDKIAPNETLVELRKLLRKHRLTGMHGEATPGREIYSDSFDFVLHFDLAGSGAAKGRIDLPMKGIVRNGWTDRTERIPGRTCLPGTAVAWYEPEHDKYNEIYRPLKGYWHLDSSERTRAAVEGLPSDAALSWEVYLDAGTNQVLTNVRLHGDHLYLIAKWKRGRKEFDRMFLIDVSCGQHNSARFGQGG